MTRDEQVRKIAMLLCGDTTEKECAECKYNCAFTRYGEMLYNAGYRKVERGTWRLIGNANGGCVGGTLYFKCHFCGYEITQARMEEANFCEWCGADMRGEKNEDQSS